MAWARKENKIPDDATAPGLNEARERLQLDRLSRDELKAYYRHLDNVVILRDNINTERAEGRAEKAMEIAMKMKQSGMSLENIAALTGLAIEEIEKV